MINILILEDEKPAFKKILRYVNDFYCNQFKYKHLQTVSKTIHELKNNINYDLILADIELLDGNVFAVFEAIKKTPPIIFCTAYNEYLIKAFKVNGISYVLKPYSQKELNNALLKYQELVNLTSKNKEQLFMDLQKIVSGNTVSFKKRFAIKKHNGIKLLETKNISFIEAYGDFCKIMDVFGEVHILSKNIGLVIKVLDPKFFFRVNRSNIINIDYIHTIKPFSKNRLSIKMKSSANLITTSTAITKDFRKWIDD